MKSCPICQQQYESGDRCPSCNVRLINVGPGSASTNNRRSQPQSQSQSQTEEDPYGFRTSRTSSRDDSDSRRESSYDRRDRDRRSGGNSINLKLILPIIAVAAAVVIIVLVLVSKGGCTFGHTWVDATCTQPKTCSECGKTEGEALGHESAGEATCTEAEVCSRCGDEISPALGHDVGADGYCTRCGEYVGSEGTEVASGELSFETTTVAPAIENGYTITPATANSTSVKEQKTDPDPHTADMAIDGLDETSWQEGVDGDGIGEYIDFNLGSAANVKAIALKLGNWRGDEHWAQNGRPSALHVQIGDVETECYFDDVKEVYWVVLSQPVQADYIRLTIDGVYQGNQDWYDTCIAEVEIWGQN